MSRAAETRQPEPPAKASPEAFREACSRFASGVAIATVRAGDGTPQGLTISSFTAVSLEPPLVLVCVDFGCSVHPHFRANDHFAVNVLAENQEGLSIRFSELEDGRFEGVDWYTETTGAPLLRGALAVFECRVKETVEAGDHAILIGEVIRAESHSGKPLLYFNRSYCGLR